MRSSFSVWVSVVATANGDGESQSHLGIQPATCKLMPTVFESIKAIEGEATDWERMVNWKATREKKAADRVKAAIWKFKRKPLNFDRMRFNARDSVDIVNKWQLSGEKYNKILAEVYSSDIAGQGWRISSPHDGCGSTEFDRKSNAVFQLVPDKSDSVTLSSTFLAAKCSASCHDIPPNVMIKYTNTCHEEAGLDALISEYAITRSLMEQSLDVAPKVFSLSAPAIPSAYEWREDNRLHSSYVEDHAPSCAERRSSVRGLVMERYTTLDDLFRQGQTRDTKMQLVIDYAIETIRRLDELHGAGFIHGQISSQTVALRDSDSRIVLVDFSHARFYPSEIGTVGTIPYVVGVSSQKRLSPWHIEGFRIGRRDDVYRVIEIIADLLAPEKEAFFDHLLSLVRTNRASMEYVKYSAKFFSFEYANKSLCELNASKDKMTQCGEAMSVLNRVLGIVRKIRNTETKPDYLSIIGGLEDARNALGS